ncbi:MAG: cation:proton antiporter [Roseiflexaceae bacterium]|nr:cation:proton antiporter [Roseiflexaceae bacterium]
MEIGTFYEIALLLGLATVLGIAGLILRQPLIVAFSAAGILAGPDVLNLIHSREVVALLSQISIAVLLFLVGLKLDVNLVRSIGQVAVATGLGQVLFTSLLGFGLCLAKGMDWLTALYVAVALTFSSTIVLDATAVASVRGWRQPDRVCWAWTSTLKQCANGVKRGWTQSSAMPTTRKCWRICH